MPKDYIRTSCRAPCLTVYLMPRHLLQRRRRRYLLIHMVRTVLMRVRYCTDTRTCSCSSYPHHSRFTEASTYSILEQVLPIVLIVPSEITAQLLEPWLIIKAGFASLCSIRWYLEIGNMSNFNVLTRRRAMTEQVYARTGKDPQLNIAQQISILAAGSVTGGPPDLGTCCA